MSEQNMASMIAADAAVTGTTDQTDQLLLLLLGNERLIKELEAELEKAKSRRNSLQMEEIPAAMEAARKRKIDYADGGVLSLKPFLSADLPSMSKIIDADEEARTELESRRLQGFGWLRANNGATIIKNQLTVEVPKGKDNLVMQLTAMADELGFTWSRGEEVHHMTLKSFLKEKLKAGANIPAEVFRLVTGQKAHYKAPTQNTNQGEK